LSGRAARAKARLSATLLPDVKGKGSPIIPATRVDPNAIADDLGVDPLRLFRVCASTLWASTATSRTKVGFQRYESDLERFWESAETRTVSLAPRKLRRGVPGVELQS